MASRVEAISPSVDRIMRLIRQSPCVAAHEVGVELALREAVANAVLHGNQENSAKRVHIRCACDPKEGTSIVVTDEGKGFDHEGLANRPPSDDANRRGIQLMRIHMDEVWFERDGSEVHMRKRASHKPHPQRSNQPLKADVGPLSFSGVYRL